MMIWNSGMDTCPLDTPVWVLSNSGTAYLCEKIETDEAYLYYPSQRVKIKAGVVTGELERDHGSEPDIFDVEDGDGKPVAWALVKCPNTKSLYK